MAEYSDVPQGFAVANPQQFSDVPQGFAVAAERPSAVPKTEATMRRLGLITGPSDDYLAIQDQREAGNGPMFTQPAEFRTALEGAGKFFTDVGLGARQLGSTILDGGIVQQMISGPSVRSFRLQQEAQSKREIDKPLMETGAGQAGYIGAGVLSTLPAAAIPGVNTVTGSALLGTGFGAAMPTTAPGERAANMAIGGVTGAAIPAAVRAAPAVVRAGQRYVAGRAPVTAEQVAARAARGDSVGASSAATDVGALTPDLRQAVAEAGRGGRLVSREALARHAEADTLPVPIRLTAGEATQDPVLLSQERNLRGKYPDMSARLDESNKALAQNLQAVRDKVGDQVFTTNMVEHGDTLINAYKRMDAAAEAEINGLYRQLRDSMGSRVPVDAGSILKKAASELHERLLYDHAPAAEMAALTRLAESRNMTFENFEALRTNLARIQRSNADGNVKAAAGVIRNALEELPIFPGSGIERMKPLADAARAAARRRFQAMEADPAYEAAVNGSVPPDRFVQKFVIGAPRDQLGVMAQTFDNDPVVRQTMGVAVLDHLRDAARLSPGYDGNFSAAGFSRALQQLDPKSRFLFDAQTAETLAKLNNVARYTTFQPRGSFVNNSNTLVGSLAPYAGQIVEGAINYSTFGLGAPLGAMARRRIEDAPTRQLIQNSLKRGAGLEKPANALIQPKP